MFVHHLPHPEDEARLRAVKRPVKPLALVVGGIAYRSVLNRASTAVRTQGIHLQTESTNPRPPARGLRPGALLVSGVINLGGTLIVLFAMGSASDARHASAWVLVQFLSGVWAGVLGANSPFFHGLVAGLPALVLGFAISSALPAHFVAMAWLLAPAAALVAAAMMRFMRRRRPG